MKLNNRARFNRTGVFDVILVIIMILFMATIPIICVYPFIQKYFVKGVMVGSIKG